jgi:hypothetical protein
MRVAVGKRLDIDLRYDDVHFPCRGFVARASQHEKSRQYGISFIYAPAQLEHFIDVFMRMRPPLVSEVLPRFKAIRTRQKDRRIPFKDAEVQVKVEGEPVFVVCQVDNISKGGMGFYSPVRLSGDIPCNVAVQISESSEIQAITGKIRYAAPGGNRYYYGMEYECMPQRYLNLLSSLEGV